MKRPTLFAFLLLSTSTLYASTNVPAVLSQDAQWDQAGSPYILQGKVIVPKGVTLHVGPGAKIVFSGAAALEVDGTLEVAGSAAAPAVFQMVEGGLQSELYLNGAEAFINNAKIISGVFLAKDSQLKMEGVEVTKGSGVYLQGSTTARLKNNKIYGNATGVVLDGSVTASLLFNSIVQNTYGLYLKSYSQLEFKNNSIRDNQVEVVNNAPKADLGGNYWGTVQVSEIQSKIQGKADLSPVKSLNDILRTFVRTQLPVITKEQSLALAAKERREEKEEKIALKKIQAGEKVPEAAAPAAPEVSPQAEAPAVVSAPEEAPVPAMESGPAGVATVKSLPAAPHTLKPLADLPPAQGNVSDLPATAPSASEVSTMAAPPVPVESAPAPAPAAVPPSAETLPPPPSLGDDMAIPPAPAEANAPSDANAAMPPPPVVSSAAPENDLVPPPPAPNAASASSDSDVIPPPPPAASNGQASSDASVPPPPAAAVPPPPVPDSMVSPAPSAAVAPPPPPVSAPAAPAGPSQDQQKAVDSLQGTEGDIEGMQAPPPDLGLDGTTSAPSTQAPANNQDSNKKDTTSNSSLTLPPLQDSDVQPPKDLDLPPTDDLGNVNLDSRNK